MIACGMNANHYFQDENGEWWCQGLRQKFGAMLVTCPVCGVSFPTKKVRPAKRCSWTCSNRANAETNGEKRTGSLSHLWKGGRHKTDGGYIRVHCVNHPARLNNTVLEHRLVMEKHIGRYLTEDETVHHKNGIKDDNRLENLELWASNHPPGSRVVDLITWAKELLEKYGSDETAYEQEKAPADAA